MNIIIHLGMPKTGSTFLQWDVFRYAEDINFVFNQKRWKDILEEITNAEKEINLSKVRKDISKLLVDDRINFISDENLYCRMWDKKDNRYLILKRIEKIFPNAKIIFSTRDKEKLLVSWYKQYVAVGGTLQFSGFIDGFMNIEKLNYETYLNKIIELFGEKNVFLYDLKEFIRNREKLLQNLCDFIGCKVPIYKKWRRNVGYGKKQLKIARFLNLFFQNELSDKGLPYPYKHFLLPHRILFQTRLLNWIPKEKITLEDLTYGTNKYDLIKERLDD